MAPLEAFRLRPAGRLPLVTDQLYGVTPPVAASVWLYDVPAVPPGSEVVLMESAPEIVIVRLFVAMALLLSATCTVKVLLPAVVGVPVMAPLEALRLRPAGRLPLVTDQLYGVAPPVAVRV